jgi:H+-transporting ATPase
MCGFGWLVPPLSWKLTVYLWGYIIVWMLIQDLFKMGLHTMISNREAHKPRFMTMVNQPLQAQRLR